jgi:hypothetical protein
MLMTNQRPGRDVAPAFGSHRNPVSVEQRVRAARDSLPGQRDALPQGALGGLPPDPQGDENRDPPPNAPTPPR